MATNAHRIVSEWLDAERAGQGDAADRTFRYVAGALQYLEPPAGFADAVIARMGALRTVPDLWMRWWVRTAVAACVLSAGAVGAFLPIDGWFGAMLQSLRFVAVAVGQIGAGAYAWVAGALAVWSGLAHAAVVLGRQLAGPQSLVILGLNFAIAAGALVALRRLVPFQEN